MNQNPILSNIKTKLSEIETIDLTILKSIGNQVQPFPNYNQSDVEILVDDTHSAMKQLILNEKILEKIGPVNLTNLNSLLNQFVVQFNGIAKLNSSQISTQHHQSLTSLQSINALLRSTGVYSILFPNDIIPTLQRDLDLMKRDASQVISEANHYADIIRSLIPEATATSLSNSIQARSSTLNTRVWGWFSFIIFIIGVMACISFNNLDFEKSRNLDSYISNNNSTIPIQIDSLNNIIEKYNSMNNRESNIVNSWDFWIKRLLIFLPLIYLLIFAISNYNKERKLLEIYIHKKTIAQALPAYIEQAKNDETKNEILLRGSSVIFSLPENPDIPIQGMEGISINDIKTLLELKK